MAVIVDVSDCEKAGSLSLEVVADPNGVLLGAVVEDLTGKPLGQITEGAAGFPCPGNCKFRLISAGGKSIELNPVANPNNEAF